MDIALRFGRRGWGFDSLRAYLRTMMNWYVYILKCSDGSLYTGVTTDVERRISEHNAKKGSKILKGKLPVTLFYQEDQISRSNALKREYEIKQFSRQEKLDLLNMGR